MLPLCTHTHALSFTLKSLRNLWTVLLSDVLRSFVCPFHSEIFKAISASRLRFGVKFWNKKVKKKNKQVRAERTHAADTKVILSDKNTVIKWRKKTNKSKSATLESKTIFVTKRG